MKRYEVRVLIGPCSEAEAETLMERIVDLPEAVAVGAVVSCSLDPDEAENSQASADE